MYFFLFKSWDGDHIDALGRAINTEAAFTNWSLVRVICYVPRLVGDACRLLFLFVARACAFRARVTIAPAQCSP